MHETEGGKRRNGMAKSNVLHSPNQRGNGQRAFDMQVSKENSRSQKQLVVT